MAFSKHIFVQICVLLLAAFVLLSGQSVEMDQNLAIVNKSQEALQRYNITCSDADLFLMYHQCAGIAYLSAEIIKTQLKHCQIECRSMDKIIGCFNKYVANITGECTRSIVTLVNNPGQLISQFVFNDSHIQEKYLPKNCTRFYSTRFLEDLCPKHIPIGGHKDISIAVWTEWRAGKCSATCGEGYHIRQRTCIDPRLPGVPLYACPGEGSEIKQCELTSCPFLGVARPVFIGSAFSLCLVILTLVIVLGVVLGKRRGYRCACVKTPREDTVSLLSADHTAEDLPLLS